MCHEIWWRKQRINHVQCLTHEWCIHKIREWVKLENIRYVCLLEDPKERSNGIR